MKILNLFFCFGILLFSACNSSQDPEISSSMETKEASEPKVLSENSSSTCDPHSYQVYRTTAEMWVQSWIWANKLPSTHAGLTYSFSKENLETLKGLASQANGLRIYYILAQPGDTIPSVALVNINTCSNLDLIEENEDCVLVSDENGGYFTSPEDVCPQAEGWRSFADSKKPFYTPVYAYNYKWDLVSILQGIGNNPEKELKVTLGLRTVGPADTIFQINSISHTGSIAYVNILHGATFFSNVQHNFDFTMPCPQYCDSESVLSNFCN